MGGLFSTDGPIFQVLDRVGHMILLNLIWLLCCLPVITIIPATTAFYYATIKSVRRGRGYSIREFFRSFRSNLKRGIPLDIALVALGLLLVYNYKVAAAAGSGEGLVFSIIYLILLFVFTGFLVYICPVLSRFSLRTRRLARMAMEMVFRHLPVTLLLIAGTLGCGILLSSSVLATEAKPGEANPAAALLLLLPAGWCYLSTFLVEPVLKKYMPPQQEGDDSWYYE